MRCGWMLLSASVLAAAVACAARHAGSGATDETGTTTEATDSTPPEAAFFYLIRVENGCGANLGSTSEGIARSGGDCPGSS